MTRYLNPLLVSNAFARLASRNEIGKAHLERTSALMYFLATDATCQQQQAMCLNCDPKSQCGRETRQALGIEFAKLVMLGNENAGILQVAEFGTIARMSTSPEQRISSNFLTVPVKKAASHATPYRYPSRPAAPLLEMGPAATGMTWGLRRYAGWQQNFLLLLSKTRSSTPCFDLAVFVSRDAAFHSASSDLAHILCEHLETRFTCETAMFWSKRIRAEMVFSRVSEPTLVSTYTRLAGSWKDPAAKAKSLERMNKAELISRIRELELQLHEANQDQSQNTEHEET